jgi:hypothetical protein
MLVSLKYVFAGPRSLQTPMLFPWVVEAETNAMTAERYAKKTQRGRTNFIIDVPESLPTAKAP